MRTLREGYPLTHRAVAGLRLSLFQRAQIDLPVPDPTTLSHRGRKVSLAADGAYDRRRVYEALMRPSAGVPIAIPPRRDARTGLHGSCKAPPHPRDENLRVIRRYGRRRWRVWCGYGRRNLAERMVSQLKRLIGSGLRGGLLSVQAVSARIRCRALAVMTSLGMPESDAVVAG